MSALLSRAGLTRLAAACGAMFAGAATSLMGPAPAQAQAVFVEVNPSTIQAGNTVSLRASCGSTGIAAKATSEAFQTVTLQPQNNLLVGRATVGANRSARGYPVRLSCATGDRATTTLWVISATAQPAKGPNTGGGYLASHSGPGGAIMIAGGLAAVSAGGVLALWAARRRAGKS